MAQMYTIHVHAIPLSDGDGKRANTVTKEQFGKALETVTDIFKAADLRFAFDLVVDWKPRKSTALNSLNNGGSKWWEEANMVAGPAQRKAKLPTDNVDFVAVTNQTGKFGSGGGTLAHEIGHYLGLFHTHPTWGLVDTDDIIKIVEAEGAAGLNGDRPSAPAQCAGPVRRPSASAQCGRPSAPAQCADRPGRACAATVKASPARALSRSVLDQPSDPMHTFGPCVKGSYLRLDVMSICVALPAHCVRRCLSDTPAIRRVGRLKPL